MPLKLTLACSLIFFLFANSALASITDTSASSQNASVQKSASSQKSAQTDLPQPKSTTFENISTSGGLTPQKNLFQDKVPNSGNLYIRANNQANNQANTQAQNQLVQTQQVIEPAQQLITPAVQQTSQPPEQITEPNQTSTPTNKVNVGARVTPTLDASAMIVSLFFVLMVIWLLAFIVKKLNIVPTVNSKGIKVITSHHLGSKEKLVIVEVNNQQHLIGVTAQQINLLTTLDSPIEDKNNLETNQAVTENSIQGNLAKLFKVKSQ